MAGSDARTCSRCGAAPTAENAKHCAYCGAELPPLPVPAAHATSPAARAEARLAALERHSDLPRLMAHTPSTTAIGFELVIGGAFLVVFVVIALTVFGGMSGMGASGMSVVPLLMALIGVGIFVGMAVRALRFFGAPLQREPALVCGKRTQVSGGGRNSSARTRYFVTLEFPGGRRQEYTARGDVMGKTADDDVGVAYLKGTWLLDFATVRV